MKIKRKKVIMIISIILLCITIPVVFVINFVITSKNFDIIIEEFYDNNKETLYEFNELCYANKIEFVGNSDNANLKNVQFKIVDGYYVYSDNSLDAHLIDNLKTVIKLFKKNRIHNIYINLEKNQTSFAANYFLTDIMLVYSKEEQSIEQIISKSYCLDARYIDDNWYITIN